MTRLRRRPERTSDGSRKLQLAAVRAFVAGAIDAGAFASVFFDLHSRRRRPTNVPRDEWMLSCWLGDVWFDVDDYNAVEDIREPEELDEPALRALLTRRLAEWDDGSYDPDKGWQR